MASSAFAQPEVLANVSRYLDWISIWTCTLVCSSWREAALPLPRNVAVELRDEDNHDIHSFIHILIDHVDIGSSIQELHLVGDGGGGGRPGVELSPRRLGFIVIECPNLRTLVLSQLLLVGPGFIPLPNTLRRLDLLKVEECQVYKEDGAKYLYRLLALFTSITTLDLDVSWVNLWGELAPPPACMLAGADKDRALPDSKATIAFVTLRNLPLDWALALADYLARTGESRESDPVREVTIWPRAEIVRGLLPWPKGEQHLVNMGEFIGAGSVGPEIEVLRINTMDYPTMPWVEFGTLEHAYLPSRSVGTLQLDQCSGVRSLLFSFESQFRDPPEDKFDLAFQAALDIIQRASSSFPRLERIFFHVSPTREAESDQQLIHRDWEDMDERLSEITTLHSAVIVHATNADEAQLHRLLPVMHKAGKVEYRPMDIPWWDLEIEEDGESSGEKNESREGEVEESNEEDDGASSVELDEESGEEDDESSETSCASSTTTHSV